MRFKVSDDLQAESLARLSLIALMSTGTPQELCLEGIPHQTFLFAREFLGGFDALSQLIQPPFAVLAGGQNNNHVDVAAAQLEVVAFGTKNPDIQGVEVPHVVLEPAHAKLDPTMNHLVPELPNGVVRIIGCCIHS